MQIETERLVLAPVSEADVQDIYQHFNQQIITYMEPSAAESKEQIRGVVRQFIEQRKQHTDLVYVITLKEEREFIGIVGLHHLKDPVPELGVWIKASAHGNHYGREAVGGMLKYAGTLGIQRLQYPVDRRNTPSRKIPLFYGGRLVTACKVVITADGRRLEEEIYEIPSQA